MKAIRYLVCLVVAGLLCTNADADTTLEELKARVEALEKASSSSLQTLAASPYFPKFGLLLQIQALRDEASLDRFQGRRSEISLSGAIVPQRIKYKVMVDPVSLSGAIAQDYFITFSYVPYADMQMGQFKYPQGLEARWSSADLDFIRRADASETLGDKRDVGAQMAGTGLRWGPTTWEYAVAAVNGAGRNTAENNEDKDFAGRGGFQYGDVWLGANGYLGHEPSGRRERFGTEFRWKRGPWKFQTEYFYGIAEPAALGLTGASVPQEGYYGLLNYRWRMVRPGLRWQSFDSNKRTSRHRQDSLTLGMDLFLAEENHAKVSLNYTFRIEEGTSIPNDDALLQFQIYF